MSASDHLSPHQFPGHWDVDTDAPSYYPEEGEYHDAVVHPDTPLTATQHLLHDHPAFSNFDPKKTGSPELVAMGGVAYINDGHHRLAAAHLAGKSVKARVWSNPQEDYS